MRIGQILLPLCALSIACTAMPAAACDAQCLRSHLDTYVTALLQHEPERLDAASKLRYTENGRPLRLGEGLWEKATSLTPYAHYFTDPVSQQALFFGLIKEGESPAIVSLRLAIRRGKIAEVEHIVARKGSHALFAPDALRQPDPLLNTPIERKHRMSREQLIAVADSYLEGIEQHSSEIVKAADDCQRIENGVQTTNQAGRTSRNCQQSADVLTYIESVDERRFPIVDIERGVVFANFTFDIPGERSSGNDARIASDPQLAARLREPRTLLLSEWFKIDGGAITHIEAVMHNLPHGSNAGWSERE
jgi:hypothetical protein